MNTAAALAAAKTAARETKKLLSRKMRTDEWKLLGRLEISTTDREGRWMVSTPRSDPLRLLHVPTGRFLVVPYARMETDFASVPALAQKLGELDDALHLRPRDHERPAFMHDQLYGAGWCWAVAAVTLPNGRKQAVAVKVPVSKRQADAMLFVALECEGATIADGLAYHGAVALFGGKAWRACRAQSPLWPPMFDRSGLKGSEVEKLKGSEAPAPSTSQPFNLSTGEADLSTGPGGPEA